MVAILSRLSILFIFGSISFVASTDLVLSYPLDISVTLVGESSNDLLASIRTEIVGILSSYFISATGKYHHDGVEFKINYTINNAQDNILTSYKELLTKSTDSSEGVKELKIYHIINFLDSLTLSQAVSPPTFLSIPIMVLHSNSLPKHRILSKNTLKCTQSVLASIAFLDLSAVACDLKPYLSQKPKHIRSQSPLLKYPWPTTFATDAFSHWSLPADDTVKRTFQISRVIGVITSAIEALAASVPIASDKSVAAISTSQVQKIICPVIFIRNNANNEQEREKDDEILIKKKDSVEGGTASSSETYPSQLDIPLLKRWLEAISLEGTEFLILTSDHLVQEHPQLSIAVASARQTYTSVTTRSHIHGKDNVTYSLQADAIPFIDSTTLLSELAKSSDSLIQNLLVAAGGGSEVSRLRLWGEQMEAEGKTKGGKTSRGKDYRGLDEELLWLQSLSAKARDRGPQPLWSLFDSNDVHIPHVGVAIAPVFVLSDLHIHPATVRSSPIHSVSDDDGRHRPIQPLLDRDFNVVTSDNVVVALHATLEEVYSYSSVTQTWRPADLTGVTALVAEGLSAVLSGARSPHSQSLASLDMVDLTWTHGQHPFAPFGDIASILPNSGDLRKESKSGSLAPLSNVVTWTSRRSILISRTLTAIRRYIGIITDTSEFLNTVVEITVQSSDSGVDTSGKLDTMATGGTTSPSPHSAYLYSGLVAQYEATLADVLSDTCMSHVRHAHGQLVDVDDRILEVRVAMMDGDITSVLSLVDSLEASYIGIKKSLSSRVASVRTCLSACTFLQSQRRPDSAMTTEKVQSSADAREEREEDKKGRKSSFNHILKVLSCLGLFVPVVLLMKRLQAWMDMKAKKVA